MIKLCIFDLDGTLVNSVEDIAYAINRGLEILGFPQHKTDEFYSFVGDGMRKLCMRALPSGLKDKTDELLKLYSEYYIKNCCVRTKPYGGIKDMIFGLKNMGIKTAVLSNKPHEQTVNVVKKLFLDTDFDFVLGQTEKYPIKPDPTSLLDIIKQFDLKNDEVLYIGDSDVDMYLAKNANVSSVGVSWGFRGREELKNAGADFIVDAPKEIEKIVGVH